MPLTAQVGSTVYVAGSPGAWRVLVPVRVKNEPWSYWLVRECTDETRLVPETQVYNDRRLHVRAVG